MYFLTASLRALLCRLDSFFDESPDSKNVDRRVWHKKPLSVALLYGFFALLVYWNLPTKTPPPGEAVAALAVAAAVMTVLGEMKGKEKVAWIFVLFAFLWLELNSIKVERTAQEEMQRTAHLEQIRNFDNIGNGIKASIAKSDQNFADTMGKTNEVLLNITGGKSFGFVVPQPFYPQKVPLLVWNYGDQPLLGVTITIAHLHDPDWDSEFYKPIFIGTVGPHDHAPVPGFLVPTVDSKSEQDGYWIMIAAQNGTVSQSLSFRKNHKGPIPWAYSYMVSKSVKLSKARGAVPKGATMMEPLLIRHWSDEVDEPH